MKRDQQRTFELWTWVTLITLVGACLATWLMLLILKAVLSWLLHSSIQLKQEGKDAHGHLQGSLWF